MPSENLWRRAQHGWPSSYPIVQFPNAPLIGAFGALLVTAVTTGSAHDYAHGAFYALIASWAWLEMADGANVLRRGIGAAGLVYVAVNVGQALGA